MDNGSVCYRFYTLIMGKLHLGQSDFTCHSHERSPSLFLVMIMHTPGADLESKHAHA